jgi:hypothetical protein
MNSTFNVHVLFDSQQICTNKLFHVNFRKGERERKRFYVYVFSIVMPSIYVKEIQLKVEYNVWICGKTRN